MSNKRPLTKEEIDISTKQIERLVKRNKLLGFQERYNELMLSEGLEQNFIKTKDEYQQVLKDILNELSLNEVVIKELGAQIAEGVEIKNVSEVKDGEIGEACVE
jgi:hypothetical protein